MFQEKVHETATYHTAVINETGVNGQAYVLGQEAYPIETPAHDAAKGNPEKFLGLALATCLNATLEAIESKNGLDHQSKVRVDVYQAPETNGRGLMFLVDVTVYIPLTDSVDAKRAQAMFKLAESRCPVAKLLGGSENVTFQLVHEWVE